MGKDAGENAVGSSAYLCVISGDYQLGLFPSAGSAICVFLSESDVFIWRKPMRWAGGVLSDSVCAGAYFVRYCFYSGKRNAGKHAEKEGVRTAVSAADLGLSLIHI